MAEYENMIGAYTLANQSVKDGNGNWSISYTFFNTSGGLAGSNLASSYYQNDLNNGYLLQTPFIPKADVIVGGSYRQDLQAKINTILQIEGWASSFKNVLKVDFVPPPSGEIGQIAIGQVRGQNLTTGNGTAFVPHAVSTVPGYTALERGSDIFFITEHGDSTKNSNYIALWNNIYTGTLAYKIIYEELSHALGIEAMNVGLSAEQQTQKYSVTAYPAFGEISDPNDSTKTIVDANTRTMTLYRPDHNNSAVYEELQTYGLQLYDIAALQKLYGRDYTTRASGTTPNTTYALGAGLGRDNVDGTVNTNDQLNAFIYTVWDGGGKDKIDVSGFGDISAKIDLRQGEFSSIGANGIIENPLGLFRWVVQPDGKINYFRDAGNVAIAYHTVIEDAVGSSSHDVIIGNAWQNTLWGGAGNDYIFGDGESYRDNLNDGDAASDSGQGYVYTDTTDPNDPNRNVPAASSDADVIYGGDGNDYIFGGEGNDTLAGGDGNDQLFGGKGDDSLLGDYGNDVFFVDPTLFGQEHEAYYGGYASVTAYNNDTVDYSQVGQEVLTGDSYGLFVDLSLTDTSTGGFTTKNGETTIIDKLYGIEGVALTQQDDTLKGSSADNIFAALGGDDHFVATRGSDLYHGGYNEQQMSSDWYVKQGSIANIETAADGYDSIDYTGANAYLDVTVIDKDAGIYWVDKYYGNAIHNGVTERDYLYSIDELTGTDKSGAAIQIYRIKDAGGAAINGNGDNNSLSYGAAPNTPFTYNGFGGNDTIHAGNQNDKLIGGTGNDTLAGGGGHDTYVYSRGDGNDRIQDSGTTTDVDTLIFDASVVPTDVTLSRGADNNVWVNISGGSTILLYAQNYTNPVDYIKFESDGTIWDMQGTLVEVKGTTGNDVLQGTFFSSAYREGALINDVMRGDAGNDIIFGLTGADTLYGDNGADSLSGGYGSDILYGGDDSDINLNGDHDNDTIFGELGNDTLYGGYGDDTLYGGAGNDFLSDQLGSDKFYGGLGADTIVCGGGADMIVYEAATTLVGWYDTIQGFSVISGMQVDLSNLLIGYNPYVTSQDYLSPARNTDTITDFVQITEFDGDSYLSVDRDGGGDAYSFEQIAAFTNTTGLSNVDHLESIGALITFPPT